MNGENNQQSPGPSPQEPETHASEPSAGTISRRIIGNVYKDGWLAGRDGRRRHGSVLRVLTDRNTSVARRSRSSIRLTSVQEWHSI